MPTESDSYYPEPESSPAQSAGPAAAQSEGRSALLPKSMFKDAKPGDTKTVKILRIYDEEVEVAPAEEGDGPGLGEAKAPMTGGEDDLAGLD